MADEKKNIFQNKLYMVLFALIAMYVWGCAYPFIKLGMIEWNIAKDIVSEKDYYIPTNMMCQITGMAFEGPFIVFSELCSCIYRCCYDIIRKRFKKRDTG